MKKICYKCFNLEHYKDEDELIEHINDKIKELNIDIEKDIISISRNYNNFVNSVEVTVYYRKEIK